MKPRHVKVRQRELDGPRDARADADEEKAEVEVNEAQKFQRHLGKPSPRQVVMLDQMSNEFEGWKWDQDGGDQADEGLDRCLVDGAGGVGPAWGDQGDDWVSEVGRFCADQVKRFWDNADQKKKAGTEKVEKVGQALQGTSHTASNVICELTDVCQASKNARFDSCNCQTDAEDESVESTGDDFESCKDRLKRFEQKDREVFEQNVDADGQGGDQDLKLIEGRGQDGDDRSADEVVDGQEGGDTAGHCRTDSVDEGK